MADVAQATRLRLLEHIHRFESPDRVGSWLASTARHECLRRIAANKKMALTDDEVRITKAALEPGVDAALQRPAPTGRPPSSPTTSSSFTEQTTD